MPVEVGIVDSGLAPELVARLGSHLLASVAIAATADGAPQVVSPQADPVGHGSQVAELILAAAPAARLLCAQVFVARRPVTVEVVAAGLRWCVAQGARVVNLSLGLRDDRPPLRVACAEAVAAGVLLVASAPARGGAVYPAAYPGVLAVSGDARCAPGVWSIIDGQGLIGTAPWAPLAYRATAPAPGGASFAAARLSGLAAAYFTDFPQATAVDFRAALHAGAAFVGRERCALGGHERPRLEVAA